MTSAPVVEGELYVAVEHTPFARERHTVALPLLRWTSRTAGGVVRRLRYTSSKT